MPGTIGRVSWFNRYLPMTTNMKRTLPSIASVLVVIPVALVLFAAKLTSGASRTESGLITPAVPEQLAATAGEDTAVFAGGCFWGVEAVYDHVKGVKRAISGYAGGDVANPSYEQVSSGDTGHAESVQVIYDPSQVSYGKLLQIFFSVVDESLKKKSQGPD